MVRHHNILSIVGNIITVSVTEAGDSSDAVTRFGDLAIVEDEFNTSIAQVIKIDRNEIAFAENQGNGA